MSQHKLLYITSVDTQQDNATLRVPTQALVSALSRDFEISLAVVGPVSQTALNELRVKLGITRVTGGFERDWKWVMLCPSLTVRRTWCLI